MFIRDFHSQLIRRRGVYNGIQVFISGTSDTGNFEGITIITYGIQRNSIAISQYYFIISEN